MPPPAVWGPALWRFLHAFAAKVGKGPVFTRIDEQREALWLVEHLDTVIPCAICRKHWRANRASAPGPPTAEWMFTVHNSVNRMLDKVILGEIPPVSASPRKEWTAYLAVVKESFAQGHLENVRVAEFTHHVGLWSSFA